MCETLRYRCGLNQKKILNSCTTGLQGLGGWGGGGLKGWGVGGQKINNERLLPPPPGPAIWPRAAKRMLLLFLAHLSLLFLLFDTPVDFQDIFRPRRRKRSNPRLKPSDSKQKARRMDVEFYYLFLVGINSLLSLLNQQTLGTQTYFCEELNKKHPSE